MITTMITSVFPQ